MRHVDGATTDRVRVHQHNDGHRGLEHLAAAEKAREDVRPIRTTPRPSRRIHAISGNLSHRRCGQGRTERERRNTKLNDDEPLGNGPSRALQFPGGVSAARTRRRGVESALPSGSRTLVTLAPRDSAIRSSIMLTSANPITPTSGEVLQGLGVLSATLAAIAVVGVLVLLRRAKRPSQLTSEETAPAET
jgi:hypothetical protein